MTSLTSKPDLSPELEETNEALLAELQKASEHWKKRLRVLTRLSIPSFIGMMSLIVTMTLMSAHHWYWQGFVAGGVGMMIPFLFLLMLFQYNWRKAKRLCDVIRRLGKRREERALALLLALRGYPGFLQHKESRHAFVDAMLLLLPEMTAERFQSLASTEVRQMAGLLLVAHERLWAVAEETLIRCGDSRAVAAIENQMRLVHRMKGGLTPMLSGGRGKWERAQQDQDVTPYSDPATMETLERCRTAIQTRLDSENRGEQLLRASTGVEADPAGTLLRGASSSSSNTRESELLRGVQDGPQTIAVTKNETAAPEQKVDIGVIPS